MKIDRKSPGSLRAPRRPRWAALCSLATTALVAQALPAQAAPKLRYQTDQRGDALLFGNTVGWDCRQGVPQPVVGRIGACAGDVSGSQIDDLWRADEPADGQALADAGNGPDRARSTAVLALPPGAVISYARLYWSAGRAAGGAGTSVLIERPGVASQTITADDSAVLVNEGPGLVYQSTADITDLLQQIGPGALRVGRIDTVSPVNLGKITYVAWSVVVFYKRAADPPRTLSLADDLSVLDRNNPLNLTLNNFLPLPKEAGFSARIGIVAYEGNATVSGDSLKFNGQLLSDPVTPAGNFFNSSRTRAGQAISVAGDLPQLSGTADSMGGLDLHEMDVTPLVPPTSTSATVLGETTQDVVYFGALYGAIATLKPVFADTTIGVINQTNPGGAVRPGDKLDLTVDTRNTGSDGSVGTVLELPIPPGMTYIPGTVRLIGDNGAGPVNTNITDAAGDDIGEYDPVKRVVRVRLGSGASPTMGGAVPAGSAPLRVRVGVTVDKDQVDKTLPLQAQVTAGGKTASAQGLPPVTWTSGGAVTPSRPVGVQVHECEQNPDCPADRPVCQPGSGGTGPRCGTACTAPESCTGVLSGPVCRPTTKTCGCSTGSECPSTMCDTGRGVCVAPDADLSIAVRLQQVPPVSGSPVVHIITVTNNGPGVAPAGTVTMTYTVPPGGKIRGVETGQDWTCKQMDRTVTCVHPGALPPGAAPDIRVTVDPPPGAAEVDAGAVVRGSGTNDPNPTNNQVVSSAPLIGGGEGLQLAGGGVGCGVAPGSLPAGAGALGLGALLALLGRGRRRRGG